MAAEEKSFGENFDDFKKEALIQCALKFSEEYNNVSTPEGLAKMVMGNPFDNAIPRTIAIFTKLSGIVKGWFGSEKAGEQDKRLKKYGQLQQLDPELFEELVRAQAENDPYKEVEAIEKYKQLLNESEVGQELAAIEQNNPEMYENMSYVGTQMEEMDISTIEQLIQQNQELMERVAILEEQLTAYKEREGIQVSENDIDFVQQERVGEEKDDKSRAIYEKDGVSIEVAEGLEAEQNQELQHGQEFAEASEEVTEEDLEIAEKEVKERDAITEDGTVSIILGNSKKITISVEPYIAGDKETQMAQEANEQEQMASREENSASTEITDDTSRV